MPIYEPIVGSRVIEAGRGWGLDSAGVGALCAQRLSVEEGWFPREEVECRHPK